MKKMSVGMKHYRNGHWQHTVAKLLVAAAMALPLGGCVAMDGEADLAESDVDVADELRADDERTAEDVSALITAERSWRNTSTMRCLDSSINGEVYTLPCNTAGNQRWTNTHSTYGDKFVNKQTGRCLDSSTSGNVYTLACNSGSFQQWKVTDKGRFGFEFRNVATNRCLYSDQIGDGKVVTRACDGTNYQRWYP